MEKEKLENKHIFKYDFIRIIFMLMTLGVHVIAYSIHINNSTQHCIYIILDSFFLICNPLFFMLSGKLNLNKKFEKKEDYLEYYKKKFITIIIPFFIISMIIYLYNYYNDISIISFVKNILSNRIEHNGTLWFIYTLIGILLLSPFFSKMLQSMNLNEKKYFLIISIGINFLITFLAFFNINSTIHLGTIGIVGWHLYYFAGYIIEDLFKEKEKRCKLYVAGLIAFIIELIIKFFIKHYYKLTDPSILLTLQAFAFYIFIINAKDIKNIKIRNIISYISRYAYVFYLMHMVIVEKIITFISIYNNYIYTIIIYVLIFMVTMFLSTIIQNLIIKPIQYILNKTIKTV